MESRHETYLRSISSTWGRKCSAFLAFSTANDDTIPAIKIPHVGEEKYNNMWQKVRNIWKYIYTHYINDFDWFLMGGDDMFYILDNLRFFLHSDEVQTLKNKGKGTYLGRIYNFVVQDHIIQYNTGSAGYIIDAVALNFLVESIDMNYCHNHEIASYEDVFVALCLRNLFPSILPHNTRFFFNYFNKSSY
jgi:glycoprotein-N-acetylgalactosamine 3-beta-galactosyltransferase